jgi:hypothetical protein
MWYEADVILTLSYYYSAGLIVNNKATIRNLCVVFDLHWFLLFISSEAFHEKILRHEVLFVNVVIYRVICFFTALKSIRIQKIELHNV